MSDATNPAHYSTLTPEPIDVIDGWKLGFCLGNVVKYIARAGRKPGASKVECLKKAAWYLNHAIIRLSGEPEEEVALLRSAIVDLSAEVTRLKAERDGLATEAAAAKRERDEARRELADGKQRLAKMMEVINRNLPREGEK